jgi:hypothetical protein
MKVAINYRDVQRLQLWYKLTGLCFVLFLFIGGVYFLYVNQNFLEARQYVLFMTSTLTYLLIPTIMHLYLGSHVMTPSLLEELNQESNRYRWLEYFFSSSIMMICIGVLLGITDPLQLTLHALLNAVVVLLGAAADWVRRKEQKLLIYLPAIILFCINWFLLYQSFFQISGTQYTEALSSIVFRQITIILALFVLFPIIFILQHFSRYEGKITEIDTMYVITGFFTKSVLYFVTLLYF